MRTEVELTPFHRLEHISQSVSFTFTAAVLGGDGTVDGLDVAGGDVVAGSDVLVEWLFVDGETVLD